jgi:hypothetical protein
VKPVLIFCKESTTPSRSKKSRQVTTASRSFLSAFFTLFLGDVVKVQNHNTSRVNQQLHFVHVGLKITVEIVHGMSPLTTIEKVLCKQVNVHLQECAVALMELKAFDDVVKMAIVNVFVIFFKTAIVVPILCHVAVNVFVFVVCVVVTR